MFSEPWPRLSTDLPRERHPDVCQSCGQRPLPGAALTCWQEHDESDGPEAVAVVLCEPCAKRLIEPHPRLYRRMEIERGEPWPGLMPVCVECSMRAGVQCEHPDLKSNGGPGLKLTYPDPVKMHVSRRPRSQSGWMVLWQGAVKCEKRVEAKP